MRTKTLKRNATNVMQRAGEIYQQKLSSVNVTLNMLLRKRKDVECSLEMNIWSRYESSEEEPDSGTEEGDEKEEEKGKEEKEAEGPEARLSTPKKRSGAAAGAGGIISPTTESALLKKQRALDNAIAVLDVHMKKMEEILDRMKKQVLLTSNTTIKRLMLEFHTGGNIRVEEGSSADVWYGSCIDLVHSRCAFRAPEMRRMGIKGVRVNRITRIHNRFLRHRFEHDVKELLGKGGEEEEEAGGGGGGGNSHSKVPKRMLEYVFYGVSPQLQAHTGNADEIVRVAEDGFRTPEEYGRFGFEESIKLHSTVDGADFERVESLLGNGASDDVMENQFALSGQILLVKAFVGNRVEVEGEHDLEGVKKGGGAAGGKSAFHMVDGGGGEEEKGGEEGGQEESTSKVSDNRAGRHHLTTF
jgi:hypothetical protein